MTSVIAIAVAVMAVALVFWNASIMRRFKSDYRYYGEFHGKRYECILLFANMEFGILCSLGANASALYLLTPPQSKRSWWSYRGAHELFKTDLQIPWNDLGWREKRIFLKDYVWFELPRSRVYFYVSKDVGHKLLIDAERMIQSEFDVKCQSENTMRS
jgi:hypothetical protein